MVDNKNKCIAMLALVNKSVDNANDGLNRSVQQQC